MKRERVGEPRPLEAFADTRVLIVLGDPGAGKSHLFREAAAGGPLMTAKRTSRPSTLLPKQLVFIDGLDEVSGDVEEALAQIISKLENAGCPPVRLSCRARDWYGAGGLTDFQEVYGPSEVRACPLLPLDEQGALAVLERRVDDPLAFLREASDRALGEFLRNPNDLILLTDAVSWVGLPAAGTRSRRRRPPF